jgi:hypothetical protein
MHARGLSIRSKIAPNRKRRLRLETLESREVFNAAVPIDATDASTDDPAAHPPGCGCGGCQSLIFAEGRTAYALSLPNFDVPPPQNGPRAPPFPTSQTFLLHTLPVGNRNRTIYLDFDGHTTTGTWWNGNGLPASWYNEPFDSDGNPGSWSLLEHEVIQNVWRRMSEDFAPFNVDVTTEEPPLSALTFSGGSDQTWGIRAIICDNEIAAPGAGGVAFVPSFKTGTDVGCFVYSGNLGNTDKNITEAASHEVGHTLGLSHDGRTTPSEGYYGGHNGAGGTSGWAPIMGVGYYQPLTQWSKGEYANANQTQDDLAIITNTTENFGYRADEAGNSIAAATNPTIVGASVSFAGIIAQTSDVDVLRFTSGAGNVTFNVDNYVLSPNLDIKIELRNGSNAILATHDPLDSLDATLTYNLPTSGTYYLFIEGVGVGNVSTTGYSDYASLGQYTVSGTIVNNARLDTIETAGLNYVENGAGLALTTTLSVSNGLDINQATVTTAGHVAGQDNLFFTNQGGITGSYNATSGVLTLTGSATPAAYQAALRSITYSNSSDNPSTAPRTFSFQVRDTAGVLSNSVNRTLTVTPVNDQPTLNVISNQTINEDAGLQTVALAGISAGAGESQTLSITALSDNTALIPNPNVVYSSPSATGTVRFTPVANRSGDATITVTLTDNGGTANGGVNQIVRTFLVTVNAVNDEPSFAKGPDPLYSALNAGPQTHPSWATALSAGPPDESGQTLTFFVSNDANALFTTQPAIASNGTLTFTPANGAVGVANVSVYVQDDGGTANGGDNTSVTRSFVINVGINRAPVLDNSLSPMLIPVAQGSVNPNANLVSTFAPPGISDPDPGASQGIALNVADNANGLWQYSIDAAQTWANFPDVSTSGSLLLRPEDLLRFLPTGTFIGSSSFSYHAWDQATGVAGGTADVSTSGGDTAFSVATETVPIRVAATLTSLYEDAKTVGNRLSVLPASTFSDPDSPLPKGIAVIGASGNLSGTWQYSINNGKNWKTFTTIAPATATLLRITDKVRFLPAANQFGEAFLTYRAWDQSAFKVGNTVNLSSAASYGGNTPFSTGTDYGFAIVSPANDRPVIDLLKTNLTQVAPTESDPPGDTVAAILGSRVTDIDAGTVPGLALTSASKLGGTWQFKLPGGEWTPVAPVSVSNALLLGPADSLRFNPDGIFLGTASISYKAWDQAIGTPGSKADTRTSSTFGTKVAVSKLLVSSAAASSPNTAPVLDNVPDIVLTTIGEDSKPAGDLVSTLLGTSVTDSDANPLEGIAITGATGTSTGVWQYSANNGKNWKPVKLVSDSFALLLKSTDKLRYVPNLNFNGSATISYRAWDRTGGTAGQYTNLTLPNTIGGNSGVSVALETASITVFPVNDRPVLNVLPKSRFTSIAPASDPSGDTVASLLGTALTDVDAGSISGIAVTRATAASGQWQYQMNGDTGWTAFTAGNGFVLNLRPIDRIRFFPSAFTGVASLAFRGWDQTVGTAGSLESAAANTSLSIATETATITVNAVNDRPVLDIKPNVQAAPIAVNTTNPSGFTAASLLGSAVSDADPGALTGIAITAVDRTNGSWEYSIDGGGWLPLYNAMGGLSVLLKSTDRLRFIPNTNFAGSTSLRYKAWDQSQGAGGSFLATTSDAFSKAIETAYLAVNTAPSLTW